MLSYNMISLPKISLPKNTLFNIVSGFSKKHLIIALVIGIAVISSGTLLLASHATNKQKKELAISSKAKPTPTVTPTVTITPTPTIESYKNTTLLQSATPTTAPINSVPTTQPQPTTSSNTISTTNNSQTPTIQSTNSIPTQAVVKTAPASAPDCSGVSGAVASVKNVYQPEIDQWTQQENALDASRGLTPDPSALQAYLQPIIAQENSGITAICANYVMEGCSCP